MEIKGKKESKNNKKHKCCISMRIAVLISYLVSIASNIILSIIIYLTNHGFKWFGYLIHFCILFSNFVSLKHLLFPS